MTKVTKVLLLLKNMIHESTSPMEVIRFAKYYKKKGLDVLVVLWGPMGILLGKKSKIGRMRYEDEMLECVSLGIDFMCCDIAAKLIGMDEAELIDGVKLVPSFTIADLLLEYQEQGQLIISL